MPKMKNSGIEWIGEVPENWVVEKGKFHFTNNKYIPGIKSSEYDRLALTLKGVINRSKDDADGLQPKDFNTYQLLRENELVFKLIDLQNISTSRVGLAHATGLVSPAYIVLHAGDKILPEYAEKFYLMMWHREIFNALGDNGVRSNLGVSDLLNVPITIPPLEVQKSIANFLDKKCSEIDSLSADIQSQIDVLEEYKKSIITEAIAKGLNHDVEMKDSGIEWIGKIPVHWGCCKMKYVVDALNSGMALSNSRLKDGGLCPVYGGGERIGYYDDFNIKDTIVIGRVGARCGCVTKISGKAWATDNALIVKTRENQQWLYYLLIAMDLNRFNTSNAQPLITSAKILNAHLPVPSNKEKLDIANYLDNKCAEIDAVIADKKAQLETLAEYKKSLIYEYITGKKEVPTP